MTPPLPLEEAQRRLLAQVEPLGSETLPVEQALGRYLAVPLVARRTQPAADLSAMDGYAVRDDDLSGPWQVVGESAAGHPFGGELNPGQAVRISTGALMPAGGGAVLLQEEAEREGERLALAEGSEATPRHVRRAGFDFADGSEMLAPGTLLGPAQLALALASGHSELESGRLPGIAVLDNGDELSADPAACAPHQIPASNGTMLAAMCTPLARSVARIGPVPDTMDAMLTALEQAGDADVIVTSGGASVGDHDLVRPALETWGATIDFWRVAMKPGKPVLVARRGSQWVVGLPGNPVSSYVTAFLFLLPLLRRLAGATQPLPRAVMLPAGTDLPGGGSRLEFRRARLDDGRVVPLAEQDSSAQRSLAAADALIEIAADAQPVRSGSLARCYLLGHGGSA